MVSQKARPYLQNNQRGKKDWMVEILYNMCDDGSSNSFLWSWTLPMLQLIQSLLHCFKASNFTNLYYHLACSECLRFCFFCLILSTETETQGLPYVRQVLYHGVILLASVIEGWMTIQRFLHSNSVWMFPVNVCSSGSEWRYPFWDLKRIRYSCTLGQNIWVGSDLTVIIFSRFFSS
jgi:hypothetical protein